MECFLSTSANSGRWYTYGHLLFAKLMPFELVLKQLWERKWFLINLHQSFYRYFKKKVNDLASTLKLIVKVAWKESYVCFKSLIVLHLFATWYLY